MSGLARRPPRHWLLAGALALAVGGAQAKTTGVGEDAALQSGPCYQTLVDRNVAQPTTAPNRELGAACAAEHDDVEKAWARVVRLWGSEGTDLPDYDSYSRPTSDGTSSPAGIAIALLGMALVQALCGTPLRSAARLMSGGGGAARSLGEAAANLVMRALVFLALLWAFGFPYVAALGALGFVIWLASELGAPAPRPAAAPPPADGFASLAADAINDIAGAAPGTLGLAALARHDPRLVAATLALALIASIPVSIRARRWLRARPRALIAAAALLAAAVGASGLDDPQFAAAGLVPRLAVAVALGLGVAAWGWRRTMRAAPALARAEGPGA